MMSGVWSPGDRSEKETPLRGPSQLCGPARSPSLRACCSVLWRCDQRTCSHDAAGTYEKLGRTLQADLHRPASFERPVGTGVPLAHAGAVQPGTRSAVLAAGKPLPRAADCSKKRVLLHAKLQASSEASDFGFVLCIQGQSCCRCGLCGRSQLSIAARHSCSISGLQSPSRPQGPCAPLHHSPWRMKLLLGHW